MSLIKIVSLEKLCPDKLVNVLSVEAWFSPVKLLTALQVSNNQKQITEVEPITVPMIFVTSL